MHVTHPRLGSAACGSAPRARAAGGAAAAFRRPPPSPTPLCAWGGSRRAWILPARGRLIVRGSIGFDLPGAPETSKSVEKTAEDLSRRACSLLLYQAALAPKPAQALLKVLLLLQKGAPTALLEGYGQFFSALAAEEAASWADYLLDQGRRGRGRGREVGEGGGERGGERWGPPPLACGPKAA